MTRAGSLASRAHARFAALRTAAATAIATGALTATLHDPPPPAPGRCVALLARILAQPSGRAAGDHVAALLGEVAGADVWRYPPASLHLSVLALTERRVGHHEEPTEAQLAALTAGFGTLALPVVEFQLGRLGLVGTQVFVEAVPASPVWAELRAAVADLATALGERPLVFPDREPVHLNAARLTGPDVDLDRLAAALDRAVPPMAVEVSVYELAVTDFVVTDTATTTLATRTAG